jgi:hypothetical protein
LISGIPPLVVNDELVLVSPRHEIQTDNKVVATPPQRDTFSPVVERACDGDTYATC